MTGPEQKRTDPAIAPTEIPIFTVPEPAYHVVEKNHRLIMQETSPDENGSPIVREQGPIARRLRLAGCLDTVAVIQEDYAESSIVMVYCDYNVPEKRPKIEIAPPDMEHRPSDPVQRGIWKKFRSLEIRRKNEARKKRKQFKKQMEKAYKRARFFEQQKHPTQPEQPKFKSKNPVPRKERKWLRHQRQDRNISRYASFRAEHFDIQTQDKPRDPHDIHSGSCILYAYASFDKRHLPHAQIIGEAIDAVISHARLYPSDDPHNGHIIRINIQSPERRDRTDRTIFDYFADTVNGGPNQHCQIFTTPEE